MELVTDLPDYVWWFVGWITFVNVVGFMIGYLEARYRYKSKPPKE